MLTIAALLSVFATVLPLSVAWSLLPDRRVDSGDWWNAFVESD